MKAPCAVGGWIRGPRGTAHYTLILPDDDLFRPPLDEFLPMALRCVYGRRRRVIVPLVMVRAVAQGLEQWEASGV